MQRPKCLWNDEITSSKQFRRHKFFIREDTYMDMYMIIHITVIIAANRLLGSNEGILNIINHSNDISMHIPTFRLAQFTTRLSA